VNIITKQGRSHTENSCHILILHDTYREKRYSNSKIFFKGNVLSIATHKLQTSLVGSQPLVREVLDQQAAGVPSAWGSQLYGHFLGCCVAGECRPM